MQPICCRAHHEYPHHDAAQTRLNNPLRTAPHPVRPRCLIGMLRPRLTIICNVPLPRIRSSAFTALDNQPPAALNLGKEAPTSPCSSGPREKRPSASRASQSRPVLARLCVRIPISIPGSVPPSPLPPLSSILPNKNK